MKQEKETTIMDQCTFEVKFNYFEPEKLAQFHEDALTVIATDAREAIEKAAAIRESWQSKGRKSKAWRFVVRSVNLISRIDTL